METARATTLPFHPRRGRAQDGWGCGSYDTGRSVRNLYIAAEQG